MATYRKISTYIWQSPTFRALGVEEKLAVIENIVLNKPAPGFERYYGPTYRRATEQKRRPDLYSAAWRNTRRAMLASLALTCQYCHTDCSHDPTIDHIIPSHRGEVSSTEPTWSSVVVRVIARKATGHTSARQGGRRMAIYRNKQTKDFCTLPNALLQDKSLSYKARGLLCYLLSKPENWAVRLTDMITHSDKDRSVRAALRELLKARYLKWEPYHEGNKIRHWEYSVYDEPQTAESLLSSFVQVQNVQVQNEEVQNEEVQNVLVQNVGGYKRQNKQKTEKNKRQRSSVSDDTVPPYSEAFEQFWKAYPVKKEKREAWKQWRHYTWTPRSDHSCRRHDPPRG